MDAIRLMKKTLKRKHEEIQSQDTVTTTSRGSQELPISSTQTTQVSSQQLTQDSFYFLRSSQKLNITSTQELEFALPLIKRNDRQVKHLKLSKSYFTNSQSEKLIGALRENTSIESLRANSTIIQLRYQGQIFSYFIQSKTLAHLGLSPWNSMSPGQMPVMQSEEDMKMSMDFYNEERDEYVAKNTELRSFLQFCHGNNANGTKPKPGSKPYLVTDAVRIIFSYLDVKPFACPIQKTVKPRLASQ